ncbi:hypothetical protein EV426DRAFT_419991 [Tirmania nivea]|nr:hypothetical protein EV426DRAFT_419991 [Tirmania nivea]
MSTTESPAPKSRGRHRANKSTPHANVTTPLRSQYNNAQSTLRTVVTPPQSPVQAPKAQQSPPYASTKKNKRKPKPRPRDVNIDVHHVHQGYDSPTASSNDEFPPTPTRGVMSTPTKAYAGPNFHSSPNPSSLPVPSWFSKSVPATPSTGTSLQAMLELSEETLSQSLEEPESHLQKLFRADKEEKTPRRQSPSLDNSFTDVFTMDPEKTTPTPSEMPPQALFCAPSQAPRVPADIEARRQADALRLFLNQPQMSPVDVEAVAERPVNQPTTPFTPARRRSSPPQHGNHSAYRAQFQTPTKKTSSQTSRSDRNPHFVMTPPKGPKSHHSGYYQTPQTPTPVRDYQYNQHTTYSSRNDTKNDSVLQLTEMELYLRRVLNLENRAIPTPAAAS